MAQAAKKPTAFLHPDNVPKTQYALLVQGDCMEPAIPHGSHVLVDPTKSVKQGDLAIFYMRDGFITSAGTNVWIKRIVLTMMAGVTFPYKAHPNSNVMPIFIVEQDNPRRQYQVPADQILGVHKCLGLVPRTTKITPATPSKRKRALVSV